MIEFHPAERFVDLAHANQIEQNIGGGVVAHDQHERTQLAKRQLRRRIEEIKHAGAACARLRRGAPALGEIKLAQIDAPQELHRNGQLGQACRREGLVGVDSELRIHVSLWRWLVVIVAVAAIWRGLWKEETRGERCTTAKRLQNRGEILCDIHRLSSRLPPVRSASVQRARAQIVIRCAPEA